MLLLYILSSFAMPLKWASNMQAPDQARPLVDIGDE